MAIHPKAPFATAQDAEDAFYDALDERNAEHMAAVWGEGPDIACLLPMHPLVFGEDVRGLWAPMFAAGAIDLQVRHLRWVELGDLAIHYVQEWVNPPAGQRAPPPVYAPPPPICHTRPGYWTQVPYASSREFTTYRNVWVAPQTVCQ